MTSWLSLPFVECGLSHITWLLYLQIHPIYWPICDILIHCWGVLEISPFGGKLLFTFEREISHWNGHHAQLNNSNTTLQSDRNSSLFSFNDKRQEAVCFQLIYFSHYRFLMVITPSKDRCTSARSEKQAWICRLRYWSHEQWVCVVQEQPKAVTSLNMCSLLFARHAFKCFSANKKSGKACSAVLDVLLKPSEDIGLSFLWEKLPPERFLMECFRTHAVSHSVIAPRSIFIPDDKILNLAHRFRGLLCDV